MKLLKDLAKDYIQPSNPNRFVDVFFTYNGFKFIDKPILESEAQCPMCESKNGFGCILELNKPNRVWFCGEELCLEYTRKFLKAQKPTFDRGGATTTQTPSQREIVWASFCEINDIGDMHHDLKFESIRQSEPKIKYLLDFCAKPCDIILMQGKPGTGKTYAAMGACELFTRKSRSCRFITQSQLNHLWLENFKNHDLHFKSNFQTVELLVIDDLGLITPSAGFMDFLFDLINYRIQYKNKGTIITTNLDDKSLSTICKEQLMDRLKMGQLFEFKGETRRIKKAL